MVVEHWTEQMGQNVGMEAEKYRINALEEELNSWYDFAPASSTHPNMAGSWLQ